MGFAFVPGWDYAVAVEEEQEYTVRIFETDGWFMALCPEMQGVTGKGRTREECLEDIQRAMQEALDAPDAPDREVTK